MSGMQQTLEEQSFLSAAEIEELWPTLSKVVGKAVYEFVASKGCVKCGNPTVRDFDRRLCNLCCARTTSSNTTTEMEIMGLSISDFEEKFKTELAADWYFDYKKKFDALLKQPRHLSTSKLAAEINVYYYSMMRLRFGVLLGLKKGLKSISKEDLDIDGIDTRLLLWRTRYENMVARCQHHESGIPFEPFIPPDCVNYIKARRKELDELAAFVQGVESIDYAKLTSYEIYPTPIQSLVAIQESPVVPLKPSDQVYYDDDDDEDDEDDEDGADNEDDGDTPSLTNSEAPENSENAECDQDESNEYGFSLKKEFEHMFRTQLLQASEQYDMEYKRVADLRVQYQGKPYVDEQCDFLLAQALCHKNKREVEIRHKFAKYDYSKREPEESENKRKKRRKMHHPKPDFKKEIEKLVKMYWTIRNKIHKDVKSNEEEVVFMEFNEDI